MRWSAPAAASRRGDSVSVLNQPVIRGLAGQGRNLKVVIEFDDQQIGTKQLLVAYAGLERDWESA